MTLSILAPITVPLPSLLSGCSMPMLALLLHLLETLPLNWHCHVRLGRRLPLPQWVYTPSHTHTTFTHHTSHILPHVSPIVHISHTSVCEWGPGDRLRDPLGGPVHFKLHRSLQRGQCGWILRPLQLCATPTTG